MEQQVDKEVVRKYLKGECSPSELEAMNLFLQKKSAEQLINEVWAEDWAEFQEAEVSDQEIAHWKNRFLLERLQDKPLEISAHKPSKKLFILRYAAVWLAILAGLGVWYGLTRFKAWKAEAVSVTLLERDNSNGQRARIRLSDNSIVYLAGGSKLIYPSRFVGNTREITLQGEAFFEVAKNHRKPFIIHSGEIRTLVVGTSFRINAFKHTPFLIEVATGKVRIARQQANHRISSLAVLTPGQSMTWKNNHVLLGQVNADDVKEWKNGRLVFNGATLKEMASVFERWYDVKVIFNHQKKAEQHITITLSASVPLSEVMEVLARTGKFQYTIKEKQVIIN